MPEYCTCGAQLPPDALFCHKCGKAQRDIPVPETLREEPVTFVPPVPMVTEPVAPPLTFRNPIAMKIALMVSVAATVLIAIIPFVNWIAGGFLSVVFYRRRTGNLLTVRAGVRLGWITGLLMFCFWTVVFTIQQVPAALSGKLGGMLQESMQNLPTNDPGVQQMMEFFQTGPGIAAVLVVSLVAFFLFITGLSMAGGALGAKLVGRGN